TPLPITPYGQHTSYNAPPQGPTKTPGATLRAVFPPPDRHTFNLFFDHGKSRQRGAELTAIDLPERSYDTRSLDQSLQGSWRAIFSPSLINEAQLRLTRERSNNVTDNPPAAVEVAGAFNAEGPQRCPR